MHDADIATLLALGAALLIAIGAVMHQRSAHAVTDPSLGTVRLFATLLHDTRWWLGTLVSVGGFGLQAAALGFGSVLLVQALLVTSLLFALPISARLAGHRVPRTDVLWALLLAGAVAVIVLVGQPTAGQSRASLGTWTAVAAVLVPAAVVCVLGARRRPGRTAAVLLGLVSATSWGVLAVLTKGVVGLLGQGPMAVLHSPELYGWAVLGTLGTMFQQSAFRAGALTVSLPTMTVTEPVVASMLGMVLLGETVHPGRTGWFALGTAVFVMVAATVALARAQAVDARFDVADDAAAVGNAPRRG